MSMIPKNSYKNTEDHIFCYSVGKDLLSRKAKKVIIKLLTTKITNSVQNTKKKMQMQIAISEKK